MNLISLSSIIIGALIISMAGILSIAMPRVLDRKKDYRNDAGSRTSRQRKMPVRAALSSIVVLMSLAGSAAEPVKIGDFYYTLKASNNTAILAKPANPYTIAEVTIPASVTDENGITYAVKEIAEQAFSGSTALTSISIPGTIASIGENALMGCCNLASLRFEPGEQPLEVANNVFNNEDVDVTAYVPMYCYIGRDINLNKAGLYYFLRFTNMQTCEIEHIKSLALQYIRYSPTLTELILHEGLEIIESSALRSLKALKNIVIPEGVTHIQAGNFQGCNALESVSLPSTLVETPDFGLNPLLTDIIVYSDTPPAILKNLSPYPEEESAHGVVHVYPSALEAFTNSIWGKDSRYELKGDLSEAGDVVSYVNIAATGPGTLALTEIDGVAAQDYPAASESELTLTLPSTAENLVFTALPDAMAEPGTYSVVDKDGNYLPTSINISGGKLNIHVKNDYNMRISADFHAQTTATLNVVMPGGKSGPLTLHIPSGAPYILQYTSTPGYQLSTVMLDDEELTFTTLEQQPSTQTEETTETTETGSTTSYQIEIPAFEGERTLRMAEEEEGIQTGVEGIEEGAESVRVRLLYEDGRACIAGLRSGEAISIYTPKGELLQTLYADSEVCRMPLHLTGLHLISVSGRTFKAVL